MANSQAYLNRVINEKRKVGAVPGPVTNRSPGLATVNSLLAGQGSAIQRSQTVTSPPEESAAFESLPCVLYECNAAFEFTYVSENISQLFDLESTELIGSPLLSDQRIPVEDLVLLSNRLNELDHLNNRTSLMHRMLTRHGLPFWVAHSLWKANLNDITVVRGCIVPVDHHGQLQSSEQAVISRFVHKIGNHFQLLNLVVNSLKRTLPECRETLILQETVEKAIELTRGFSDYHQAPTCLSWVKLMDILQASAMARRSSFEKKGVIFENQIQASVDSAAIQADPYLLELAFGHVLQNALEATEAGGHVTLLARVKCSVDNVSVASISITDSGCGMDESVLGNVVVPFFTSKKNHDGLGLSMASRFIEIHGGILRIKSAQGKGTEVEIILPIETKEAPAFSRHMF
jgi:nitrogen-specific signal transduction histidine kinase